MSAQDAVRVALERLSDGQIEALARVCDERAQPTAGSTPAQAVAGASPAGHDAVDRLMSAWATMPGLTGPGVALALRVGLAARREAAARRSRAVWTGPGAAGEQRLTAAVLHDLIAGARERILLVSYAAFTLPGVADDLAAAIERGCEVDVVFETEQDSAGAYSGSQSEPFGAVAGLRRWHWPSEQREVAGAALHAKVLVVDGRRALVGSANLTHRALSANLEAGVLIEDIDIARALEGHVRGLMASGTLVVTGR